MTSTGTDPRHVVLVTSRLVGLRNASLELARRLEDAGFRVTYASRDDLEAPVEASGIPFLRLPGRDPVAPPRRSRLQRLAGAVRIAARRRAAVAALDVDPAIARLREAGPDLVLIDLELHPLIIAGAAAGLPVALLTNWMATWKRPGVPPLHHALVPTPGLPGRLRVELAWLRYRIWKLAHRRFEWLRRAGVDRVSVLRALARQHGFPFRREVDLRAWQLPFSYRRLPLVDLNARELDLPHEPPARVRYVGPMVRAPEAERPAGPPEAAVDTLLAGRRGSGRALIYVAFGSFFKGDDTPFVRRVLAALAEQPDVDAIVTLGGRTDPGGIGPVPHHIHVFPWVPQARVIASADAAIIHGGINTINECIRFGVPMLAYPFRTNDQMGTAARIAFHGLGMVGDRGEDAATILAKLQRVLSEPAFRRQVDGMRRIFEGYERRGEAAAAVGALIERARGATGA